MWKENIKQIIGVVGIIVFIVALFIAGGVLCTKDKKDCESICDNLMESTKDKKDCKSIYDDNTECKNKCGCQKFSKSIFIIAGVATFVVVVAVGVALYVLKDYF